MAIEPQVFICYGRPDRDVAHAIAAEFWRNRIECYNYMGKPTEDRLGNELPHLSYIYSCRLFIAIISEESIQRYLVAEEIAHAQQMASLSEKLFRVHILKDVGDSPFPKPDLVIKWRNPPGLAGAVSDLLSRVGTEFVERNQKAWEINKSLYPEAWSKLDELYGDGSISEVNMPEPAGLLDLVLNKSPIELYLREDLAKISSADNRWYLFKFLAEIVAYADTDAAHALDSEARYLGKPNPCSTSRAVEYKQYAPNEKIETVSQVIRGGARIVNALAEANCDYAYDIAKRFTWQPTKTILFCGIFGRALGLRELKITKEIYSSLGFSPSEKA